MRVLGALLLCAVFAHQSYGRTPAGMIGVGLEDHQLYTRSKENGKWKVASGDTCCVIAVALLPDGSLVGVGEDNELYVKKKPSVGDWEGPVPGGCCVKDIAVMADGTIIGVDLKNKLVYRADLEGEWSLPEKPCCIFAVDALPDGRILAVARNGKLRIREGIEGRWKFYRTIGTRVNDISTGPDGAIYGVSRDDCGVHKLAGNSRWQDELAGSECMLSITSADQLAPPNIVKEEEE
ncbi:uncharacterized protein [Ptychodera flava]|uniref:uncharacterized protein n=1 Tax=Ptychodera flava TaxID=63121 RepID=UPI003969F395